jgi:hypothetical protein
MGRSSMCRPLFPRLTLLAVCVGFIVAGAWTATVSKGERSAASINKAPAEETRTESSPVSISSGFGPIRGELRPLRLRRSGFEYRCSECHQTFQRSERHESLIAEHQDIVLNHGRNDYCLNCHHTTNRDAYVTHDGGEISSDSPAELCAKCHGPHYRDWENGAHGRREGFWDESLGEQKRVLCIQCHDPHSPRFPSLRPMPGPRVGGQEKEEGEHGTAKPDHAPSAH